MWSLKGILCDRNLLRGKINCGELLLLKFNKLAVRNDSCCGGQFSIEFIGILHSSLESIMNLIDLLRMDPQLNNFSSTMI